MTLKSYSANAMAHGPDGFIRAHYGRGPERVLPFLEAMFHSYNPGRSNLELCNIMNEEQSDKASGWHNYTQFYSQIFGGMRQEVKRVLEVGIGTNNVDVPSSMGPDGTPGASLRGWKRYFPNATVYGADVDKRILFSEPRIETFFVDQLDQAAIADLRDSIGQNFDIIIDDGLHTFEGNINLIFGLFDCVKRGGVYIIEDVVLEEQNLISFDRWVSHLHLDAVLLDMPSQLNKIDNALFVIFRP